MSPRAWTSRPSLELEEMQALEVRWRWQRLFALSVLATDPPVEQTDPGDPLVEFRARLRHDPAVPLDERVAAGEALVDDLGLRDHYERFVAHLENQRRRWPGREGT